MTAAPRPAAAPSIEAADEDPFVDPFVLRNEAEADVVGGADERGKDSGRVVNVAPKRQLSAVNIKDFLARDIPAREMILAPIIPAQGLAMIFSWRGVGKTHVALGIAYAIATGGKFLRWEAPKARRVLYLDGEMPAKAMQERFAAIVAGADKEPPSPEHLRLVTPDLQSDPMPNLATLEGQEAVEALLGDGDDRVALLVIDNLSTLVRTDGENEADAWDDVQSWLLSLRRRGVSVLLVHHAGKGGSQRGTSRREDILDTVVSLRRPSDYQETEGARFEVHVEKARSDLGDAGKAFEAKLEVRNGAASWTTRDVLDANLERVRAMLQDKMSVRDIADDLGISKSAVHRLKKKIEGGDGHGE